MERDLGRLAGEAHDLVVVGGGIYGACVAWDAALRGLKVALLERGDFAAGTSANSLKVIHGGFRHLQRLALGRARTDRREQCTWVRIAPHLVEPLPVLIPTYRRGRHRRALFRAAFLADRLVGWGLPGAYRVPAGRILSREECARLLPMVPRDGLTGAALFHDAQVYDSERLVVAILRSAAAAGAGLANYVEVTGFLRRGDRVVGVEARDALSGARLEVRGAVTVACCGPWNGPLLGRLGGAPGPRPPPMAKAFNLVVPRLLEGYGVGLSVTDGDGEAPFPLGAGTRLAFIVPWRDRSLIGTAYVPHEGDPEGLRVSREEARRFLESLRRAWPGLKVEVDDVLVAHCGLVPCDRRARAAGRRLATVPEVVDHRRHGVAGLISVLGVKYTGARHVAGTVVDLVFRLLGRRAPPSRTASTPVFGGDVGDLAALADRARGDVGRRLGEDELVRLIRSYGTAYRRVVDHIPLGGGPADRRAVLRAEVRHGVREEMARRLADVVFRRTDLGTAGHPGREALALCAEAMAAELGWSPERTREELATVEAAFSWPQGPLGGAGAAAGERR